MKFRVLPTTLLLACLAVTGFAAGEADKKADGKDAPKPAPDSATPPAPAPKDAAAAKAKEDQVVILPPVEIRKSRITELEHELAQLDKDIAREKKNTKASDLDKTLNDPKLAHTLAIFGGKSSEDKESLARQRLALLEAERDLIMAITQAKTKAEQDEMETQLAQFKVMSRDLENPAK